MWNSLVIQGAVDLLKSSPAPQWIMYTQDLSDLFLPRTLVQATLSYCLQFSHICIKTSTAKSSQRLLLCTVVSFVLYSNITKLWITAINKCLSIICNPAFPLPTFISKLLSNAPYNNLLWWLILVVNLNGSLESPKTQAIHHSCERLFNLIIRLKKTHHKSRLHFLVAAHIKHCICLLVLIFKDNFIYPVA